MDTEMERKTKTGSDKSTVQPPDGGLGWVIVATSFVLHLVADGIIFSFGTFFVEFTKHFNQTESATAWIGSTLAAMPLLGGPLAAYFADLYGCEQVTIVGGVLATIGFLLSSISTTLFFLIVTFGLITGSGLSLCYIAGVDIINHYFEKRLSLATGLAVSGGGIGTFLYAPLIQSFVELHGWQMATVMLSGNFLIICLCGYTMNGVKKKLTRKAEELESLSSGGGNGDSTSLSSYLPSSELQQSCTDVCTKTSSSEWRAPRRCKSTGDLPELLEQEKHKLKLKRYHSYDKSLASSGQQDGGGDDGSRVLGNEDEHQQVSRSHEIRSTQAVVSIEAEDAAAVAEENVAEENVDRGGWVSRMRRSAMATLSNKQFLLFLISNFILYACYDVPYIFLQSTATQHGHSVTLASYFISAIGLANVFGDILLGYLGDKTWIRPTSIYGLCTIICGVSTILMPYAMELHYYAVIVANAVFGATVAANSALTTVILVESCVDKFAFAYGLLMFVQGVGNLLGPPIAGNISAWNGSSTVSFVIAGIGIIISGGLLFAPMYRTTPLEPYSPEQRGPARGKTDAAPADHTSAATQQV